MASAQHHRVKFIGFDQRVLDRFFGVVYVIFWQILVVRPLHDVTEDIIKTPGVWFLLTDIMGGVAAVVTIPGVLTELIGIVTKEIGGRLACTGSIFPFCLSWQAVEYPCLFV